MSNLLKTEKNAFNWVSPRKSHAKQWVSKEGTYSLRLINADNVIELVNQSQLLAFHTFGIDRTCFSNLMPRNVSVSLEKAASSNFSAKLMRSFPVKTVFGFSIAPKNKNSLVPEKTTQLHTHTLRANNVFSAETQRLKWTRGKKSKRAKEKK